MRITNKNSNLDKITQNMSFKRFKNIKSLHIL